MKLLLIPAALLLLAVSSASAAPPAPPADVVAAASEAGFNGEVAAAHLTGTGLLFAQSFGYANRSSGRRVTLDTAFNLASMGKMFTGVASAQLVGHGKLHFSDRIGKYLPELPRRLRGITVAQLLDHTSGLGDFFNDPGYEQLLPHLTTLSAYLPLVEHERLLFAPGTRWSYSNSGFLLAGLVIEKASGEGYYAYLAHHIWAPAGMTHTGCYRRAHLPAYAAIGYEDGGAANTASLAPLGTSAGGCYSSARDMITFARALESHRLLSARLTSVITTSKVSAPGGGYGYGFGIRGSTVWHNGGAPGAAGELDINPTLGLVVVTLGNVDPPHVFPVVDAALNALQIP